MTSMIHQPNDKLFKLSLEDSQVAQAFFKTHLPLALLQKMDLSTLTLEKQTFIDETYKNTAADVLYQVQLEQQSAYIYILCEQQTDVDAKMAFRLLSYTLRIMETHCRKHSNSPLPFVHPLVVYSGEKPWQAALEIFPLFGKQEDLARQHFLKPYQLFDIQRTPDETLKQHHLCGIMEFALKYQKVRDLAALLETLFPWMQALETQNPEQGLFLGRIVLQYLLDGIEADDVDVFTEKANHFLNDSLRGEAMTLAQRFEERGMQRGMRQGEVALLTQQLQYRFGELPSKYLDLIAQTDAQTLLQLGKKMFDAKTLEEIFNE